MRFAAVLLMWFASGCDGGEAVPVHSSTSPTVAQPTPAPTDPGPDTSTEPTAGAPTWYQDVAPLVADRCASCHLPGGIGPFSLETYEDAEPWGEAMLDSIEANRMPPFDAVSDAACEMEVGFLEDLRLSDEDKAMFRAWVEAGKPEGDPQAASPAPVRVVEDLQPVDGELSIQEPFAVSGTEDIYQCFRIPLPNTDTRYLTGLQVIPGNDAVVHHVIVWNDPNDSSAGQAGADGSYPCSGFPDIFPTEIVSHWTPGTQPMRTPENTGVRLEANSSLVLNIHYHPTGTTTEFDQTKLRLQWSDEAPDEFVTWYLVDIPFGAQSLPGPGDEDGEPLFRIPANEEEHLETVQMWFTSLLFFADMPVFAITPHMHYLGTDMIVDIVHNEDGGQPDECIIHTPGFRFDWQRGYNYDPASGPMPVIHRGDQVRVTCKYNNSTSNPYLPQHLAAAGRDAPADVYWGEETGDEMCMAIIGLIVPENWSPLSWF